MDTTAIDSILNWAATRPVLLSLVLAGAAAFFVTLVVERYLLPTVHDPDALRRQKGATFLLCVVLSAVLDVAMWWALAPGAALGARIAVSVVAGILTSFLYPIVARWASQRWPSIGSAWVPRE